MRLSLLLTKMRFVSPIARAISKPSVWQSILRLRSFGLSLIGHIVKSFGARMDADHLE